MDELVVVAGVLGLASIVLLLVREWLRGPWLKELAGLAVAERNRNRLGDLRTRLMAHVRDKRIQIESPVFLELYRLLTRLMREPYEYRAVAEAVLTSSDAHAEQKTWGWEINAYEAEMLLAVANALDLLCRDYNPTYSRLARIYDFATRRHRVRMPLLVHIAKAGQRVAERSSRYRESVEPVRKASHRLASMGGRPDWHGASTGEHHAHA